LVSPGSPTPGPAVRTGPTRLPAPRTGSYAAAPEIPFFMQVKGLPVYCVLHEAVAGRPGVPVGVHVHGLGVEQITLYRQEVLAARAAAARGIPVLRFHARGHGDSAGSSADVTLETLVEDAQAAADVAKQRTGRGRVAWLGIRMGAIVAALAGGPRSGRTDAAGFAFWEPVAKPADFFRQQLRTVLFSKVAGGQKPDATVDQLLARIAAEGELDVFGYTLRRALVDSFSPVTLADALAGVTCPVLLAQVQPGARLSPAHARLAEALGPLATVATVREEPGYQLMSNPAWESAELTRVTEEWLDALA